MIVGDKRRSAGLRVRQTRENPVPILDNFPSGQSHLNAELLPEKIARVLVDAILSGRIESGAQLIEADLQQYFGISRTPLREAFRELERQGFVESIPRRGTFVKKIEERDVREVYLVRVNLEGMAARLAHENMTPERLQELRYELDGMEDGARNRDTRKYMKHHDAYHDTFIRQSENRVLIDMLDTLRRQTNWHRFYFSYHDSHFTAALNSHRHIHETFADSALTGKQVEEIISMHVLDGFVRFQQHIHETRKDNSKRQ